jgi:hypothetical protein
LTVADPTPTPVTCGCVAGIVAPFKTTTLAGTVTFEVSVTVKSAGAGADKVTVNGAESPRPTITVAGRLIVPGFTVTLPVALGMFGALAVITAEPPATPVTGTFTVVAFAAKVTVEGTVATPVLLELRLMVKPPAGACPPDKFNARFPVAPALIVRGGPKPIVTVTCTCVLPGDV